jgi:hypothetical protein
VVFVALIAYLPSAIGCGAHRPRDPAASEVQRRSIDLETG